MAERNCEKCLNKKVEGTGCKVAGRMPSWKKFTCSDYKEKLRPDCSKCINVDPKSVNGCTDTYRFPKLWDHDCTDYHPKVEEVIKFDLGRIPGAEVTFTLTIDPADPTHLEIWDEIIKAMADPEDEVIECFFVTSVCGSGLTRCPLHDEGDAEVVKKKCTFIHEKDGCCTFSGRCLSQAGFVDDSEPGRPTVFLGCTRTYESREVEELVPGMPGYCFYQNIGGTCGCQDALCTHRIMNAKDRAFCGLKPSWKVE